ncbi:hypothetical protein [Seonamhaeicola sp.]|uniref:hypothetical protein n=1 Tax=Seonamhaeicola sp. TaxID=1912245 RepID=UPI002603BE45|nr:hypothetical protein [Seonamhaeicola sp.]
MTNLTSKYKLKKHFLFTMALGFISLALLLQVQDVKRSRPTDWDGLVYGGRFMDRFLPLPDVGELRSDVWGADAVKPRHINNGLEDNIWSYWGKKIQERNNPVNLRIIINHQGQEPSVLKGLVVVR